VDETASAPADRYGDRCFLCLRAFSATVEATREDVVPRWLIRLAGLHSATSVLPGGQMFRYGQRTVSCCRDCNAFMAAELEVPLSSAINAGFDAVQELPVETLFLWLAKIYYGTRWREIGLRTDVTDPESSAMLQEDELLGAVAYLRLLLLSGPNGVRFGRPPGSLFLYRAGVPDLPANRFDFFVPSLATDFISLRVNDVFVMCVFGDNGHWEESLAGSTADLACKQMALHPAQCIEAMFRVYSHTAAFASSGCYDLISVGDGDASLPGGVQRLFVPRFVVESRGIPRTAFDRAFSAAFLDRAFGMPMTESVLAQAERGSVPTCLFNPVTGEPVVTTCFEPTCPALRLTAGWVLDPAEPPCHRCGTGP
jgi:hypothetical protein